jgi:hypothetical protein
MPNIDEYGASIVYGYAVDGRQYTSRNVSFGVNPVKSRYRSRDFAQNYASGRETKVSYDPSDPARAVLEPGETAGVWILPMVGALLTAGGCANAATSRRALHRVSAAADDGSAAQADPQTRGAGRSWFEFLMLNPEAP